MRRLHPIRIAFLTGLLSCLGSGCNDDGDTSRTDIPAQDGGMDAGSGGTSNNAAANQANTNGKQETDAGTDLDASRTSDGGNATPTPMHDGAPLLDGVPCDSEEADTTGPNCTVLFRGCEDERDYQVVCTGAICTCRVDGLAEETFQPNGFCAQDVFHEAANTGCSWDLDVR